MDRPTVTLADIVLWKAVQTAVEDMLRRDPVQGEIVSTREVIQTLTALYVMMIRRAIRGDSLNQIEQAFKEGMDFIKTVTEPF